MCQILKIFEKMERKLGGNFVALRKILLSNTLNCVNTRAAYLHAVPCLDWGPRHTSLMPPAARSYSVKGDREPQYPGETIASKILSQRKAGKKKVQDAIEKRQMKIQKDIEYVLEQRKKTLKNARKIMQERGKTIMRDIKETKNKMREKLEGVIERENIYTIPNLLCITRIGLSPFLGYLIITDNYEYALAFMVVAGISDWIDGWVARSYKSQCSKIGSFLDPMADKVLIGTLFLSLTYVRLIPVALTALVIFRDVILIISGFVIRYRSLPPPRTLSRYFDATHATAQLAPTSISKINTGVQLVLVGTTLAAPVFGYVDHGFLHAMWYFTATSTVASAASYLFSKQTYKYLKKSNY